MASYPNHCYPIIRYPPRNIPDPFLREEYRNMNRAEILEGFRLSEDELIERIIVDQGLIERHRADGHCLSCSKTAAWEQRAREILYMMDLTGCSLGFILCDGLDSRPHWRHRMSS